MAGTLCGGCGGRGIVVNLHRLRMRTPPGLDDGDRIRLPGRGNQDESGRSRGDLYVSVRVRPHPHFRRRGPDILTEVPITVSEAALGAQIEIPTIDGPVRVSIPPGTSGGQRFRIKGRGIPLPSGGRGDQYYAVRIVVPRDLDRRAREVLRSLDQGDPRAELPREGI